MAKIETWRRLAARVAAALAAGLAFTALTAAAAEPSSTSSTLSRVEKSGVLRVCTTGDYRPFTDLQPDGSYVGIDIDQAHLLAKALGVKVDFVKTTWPTLMQDFTAGKCDIAMGGISVTLARQKVAAFSTHYMVDGKTPIARCADADKYQTLQQIDQPDVRVIVNPGGTNFQFAKDHLQHAEVIVYPDNTTIFQQLVDGKADVMVTDGTETLLQHKLHPQLCPVNPNHPLTYGEKAYLIAGNDLPFQDFVDQWLNLEIRSGEFKTVVDKWLG
ncbi:Cyclohexadienyl dehydratase (Includes: Prephenate dehydratase; Arogenate dehydratase) [Thiomonas sp. X19]|nr:Cyclohexadienyl dehydratase (Includes: Prephenate dehydratase; Arogenate dehydratase) [Thiomonas sp. X19]